MDLEGRVMGVLLVLKLKRQFLVRFLKKEPKNFPKYSPDIIVLLA